VWAIQAKPYPVTLLHRQQGFIFPFLIKKKGKKKRKKEKRKRKKSGFTHREGRPLELGRRVCAAPMQIPPKY
jgi:hypothetical protein